MTTKNTLVKGPQGLARGKADDRELHPSVELLRLYLRREIEERDRDAIRHHLEGCERCVEEVLALDSFLTSVAENEADEEPPKCAVESCEAEAARNRSVEDRERVWKALRQKLGEDATASGFVLSDFWPQIGLSPQSIRRHIVLLLTTLLATLSLWGPLWARDRHSVHLPEVLVDHRRTAQACSVSEQVPNRRRSPFERPLGRSEHPPSWGRFIGNVLENLSAQPIFCILTNDDGRHLETRHLEARHLEDPRAHWRRGQKPRPGMPLKWCQRSGGRPSQELHFLLDRTLLPDWRQGLARYLVDLAGRQQEKLVRPAEPDRRRRRPEK